MALVSVGDYARAAGLQLGDRVIPINGRPQPGWGDLFVDLHRKDPGEEMVFSIDRQGQRLTLGTKIRAVQFGTGAMAIAVVRRTADGPGNRALTKSGPRRLRGEPVPGNRSAPEASPPVTVYAAALRQVVRAG